MDDLEARFRAACDADDLQEIELLGQQLDRLDEKQRQADLAPDALKLTALAYAAMGLRVLPVRPGDKRPANAHGLTDATSNEAQIREWWRLMPRANIGIATGHLVDVVDIDGEIGWQSRLEQASFFEDLPLAGQVCTPRGRHYYVPATGAKNSVARWPGIDYRGLGGYVVAPPSRTPHGFYVWSTPLDFEALWEWFA